MKRRHGARAEAEQKYAEAEKKRTSIEADQQKKVAAERQKKQAEENASYAKVKAEEEAKAADERRKIRVACSLIYKTTADKKVSDLTVKEAQQVQACQVLGFYPPR